MCGWGSRASTKRNSGQACSLTIPERDSSLQQMYVVAISRMDRTGDELKTRESLRGKKGRARHWEGKVLRLASTRWMCSTATPTLASALHVWRFVVPLSELDGCVSNVEVLCLGALGRW